MKFPSLKLLLGAASGLCLAACTPEPGDENPVGNDSGNQDSSTQGTSNPDEANGDASSSPANNALANRLRLPDMTGLPTDKELAPKPKPDTGGSGVIARPPSE